MRTSDERVRELHQRMETLTEKRNNRQFIIQSAAICTACLAVVIALALIIAKLPVLAPEAAESMAAASIFASHTTLGYIVIALLAFCLGALVTAFCFRVKRNGEV